VVGGVSKSRALAGDNRNNMLAILYQDESVVAVHKPPGLLVHKTGLDAHEQRFAVQMLRDQLGQKVWPVHRLDKGTSGVLLFALNSETASHLGQQFENNAVQKTYHAMVRGWPSQVGVIDHPLQRLNAQSQRVGEALPAITRFAVLQRFELPLADRGFERTRCALLELEPEAGRQHQLRRHCKHISHPIVGDATYGKGPLNRAVANLLGMQRLWLQAFSLGFAHPWTTERLNIQALPEPEWDLWLAHSSSAPSCISL
jgi:tRNA pseudouridine65 synthase